MQFYIYDFSEYILCDVEADGLFSPYAQLEDYWQDTTHRFPYIIKKENNYAGFALVRLIGSPPHQHLSIAEFFIMRRYRREGLGRSIAIQLFDLHKGQWEIYQKESNKPARAFWLHTITGYTHGQFIERFEDGRTIQSFKSR